MRKLPWVDDDDDGYDGGGDNGAVEVAVCCVEGDARRKELARMASGDSAEEEAELFADALLKEGERRKNDIRRKR